MEKLTLAEGKLLIAEARKAINAALENKKPAETKIPDKLLEPSGVFVTIHKNNDLRGCIGHVEPETPLINSTREAAIFSALHDPRFPPVKKDELSEIKIEVSVLTKPVPLKSTEPKDRVKEIKVGRDGLVVDYGPYSGLLLPQVPVEEGWDEEIFLGQTCWKAGLEPSTWLDPNAKLSKFECQIFAEEAPSGKVVEKKLMKR